MTDNPDQIDTQAMLKRRLSPAQIVAGRRMKPTKQQQQDQIMTSSSQQDSKMEVPMSSEDGQGEDQPLQQDIIVVPPAIAAKLGHQKERQERRENTKKHMDLMNKKNPVETLNGPLNNPWPIFVQKKYNEGKGDPMTRGQKKRAMRPHQSHQMHTQVELGS